MSDFDLKLFAKRAVNHKKNGGLHPDAYERDKAVCFRETSPEIVKERLEKFKIRAGQISAN